MKSNNNISERIEALQAINLIKNLKFRYWNACDLKKPADIRDCFCSDEVYINFEEFGTFSAAKDMVEKYELQSCHAHLIEQHAGKNPIITLLSNKEALGSWALSYSLIDTQKNIHLNISGIYEDLYVQDNIGNWLIKKTVFKKRASVLRSLASGHCSNTKIARSLKTKKTI